MRRLQSLKLKIDNGFVTTLLAAFDCLYLFSPETRSLDGKTILHYLIKRLKPPFWGGLASVRLPISSIDPAIPPENDRYPHAGGFPLFLRLPEPS